ncbi:MAG: hypothetical protein K9G67_13580 [Bacteroidales bacterium]|nr:hypothetical protein [Bacteroidales bacterium]MCF8344632.1 hypothetical protein [Bacteroidales bacterium]MCF8351069.1 hypothetical protein [Bacteroidales bacterium]MCF8377383.1 hypothetical protein [Bacteroidales bacterium]MCF8402217.1 hypothetical protein [Bacteroidales bacterium]
MKGTLPIGLAFLLLISTTGVTINKQISHEELFSIALFENADACCANECPCCYEESKTIRIKDQFLKPSSALAKGFISKFATLLYDSLLTDLVHFHTSKAYLKKDKLPPNKNSIPEYGQVFIL